MKKFRFFLLLIGFICFGNFVTAEKIQIHQGKQTKFTITKNDYTSLKLQNILGEISHFTTTTKEGNFVQLVIPGYGYSNEVGDPKIPVLKKIIEVPFDADFNVNIISESYQEFDLAEYGILNKIFPAQPPLSKSIDNPEDLKFMINESTYLTNAYLSSEMVKVTYLGQMRSANLARLEIAPILYNPVTNKIKVYYELELEINFAGGDVNKTINTKKDLFSPFFESTFNIVANYKQELSDELIMAEPVTYVIVSDPMFQTALQPFVAWKTKKGFQVIEAYTNDPAVGTTTTSIKSFLQSLFNNPHGDYNPQSFVLFVGDVAQIPAFNGTSPYNHVTDLYYCEYTGDIFPECYYGRFSANNLTELQPQIDKTLEYEQYLMPDPSFLDEVVMVAGADASHAATWGNGQINYGTTYYFNAAHGLLSHTYLQPEPGGGNYSANIRQNVSDGVAYANYTAHCSTSGWANPSFVTSHISALENAHKYCLMVGNCCSSLEFQTTCFGEEVLRAIDKGALGYIGGSNSTYWDEDYWWGVGYEAISANPVYNAGNLGSYDRTFHDNGEPLNEWFVTQGQMPSAGNLAVTQAGASLETYYWEIYHLMGDPSLMIYMSQPPVTNATYAGLMALGSATFTVNTEPYAYVGITKDGLLHGAGIANAAGFVEITMNPPITVPGTADVVVTRQNGQPYIGTVTVASPPGPYVLLESFQIDDIAGNNNGEADYNEQIALDVTLENQGSVTAYNVNATLISSDPYITITDNSESFGTINSGATSTQNDAFTLTIADDIPDQYSIDFELEVNGNADDTWTSYFTIVVNAPILETGSMLISDAVGGNGNGILDPGETADLIIETSNTGNSDSPDANATLACTNPYITINNTDYNIGSIATGATEYAVFNISVDGSTPIGTNVNFDYDVIAGNYSATDSYNPVIGQIPVLILDLDPNVSSGPAMGMAMTNLGVPYDYATSFPTDINLYSSVFVCLGIFSGNHVLSGPEGQNLANYLNSAGRLYMEGGDTWAYDSQTAVHSMFNIDGVADGTGDMNTVAGQSGTFTEGMSFTYSGENNWMDHINPIAPAVQIFMNQSPSYGCGVAYDAGTYKTIGTSYEFGGLNDGSSPSTKEELMYQYLDFFGLMPPEVYTVDLTVFLEGPFNETEMETNLNLLGLIPNEQPYGSNPWYYSGSENVVSIPNNDIVDWILVEFRDAPGDASTATSATTFEYQAAFLLKDGSIVGVNGYTDLILNNQVNNNLYAVIHHRNHIPIMSSGPIPLSGNLYEYDFTGSETTVYGGATGYVEIALGIWGMVSGDGLCDGVINMDDKIVVWEIEAGISGYHSGDFNMNGNVDNKDKNDNWKPNIGKSFQEP